MKNLNKILIIPILLSCFSFSLVLADNSDCGTFGNLSYKQEGSTTNGFKIVNDSWETDKNRFTNFLTIDQQKAIITKDDLNTAILNLKKYCCEHNHLGGLTADTCKQDEPFFNSNALDSPYLFDHLFDVIMRRLNGINGENEIYTKTKMTLDDKGKERRDRINKQATSTLGSTPQTIVDKYQDTRKQSPSNLGYNITSKIDSTFGDLSDQDFLIYVSGSGSTNELSDSKKVAEAMRNYDKRTLYDRYINACALSKYFYGLLDLGPSSNDKGVIIKKTADNACTETVKKQINGEMNYAEIVVEKSSNLFLANYLEGYISYLYGRQQKLQKLRKDSSDRWLDVIRAVPCLQKKCTKDR